MSIKRFLPDTPKEYAFLGSAFARLGTMASAVTLFTASPAWVLGTLIITWGGHEFTMYMKLQDPTIEVAKLKEGE